MNSTKLVVAAGLLVASTLYYLAVRAARKHRWPSWILVSLSALSGAALLVMVLTDWPGEQLNTFWADHSVFTSVLSTVLLVSIGYLAFEAGETSKQAELDRSVTTAGMSGLVDRLVDVEIGLSLLHRTLPPQEYRTEGRPLEWVRTVRDRLQREEDVGAHGRWDAAEGGDTAGGGSYERNSEWQMDLVDQCVRRIIGGMRDWAALVGMSEEGRNVLRRFGEIRLDLLAVQAALRAKGSMNAGAIDDRRIYLRMSAYSLEQLSSPDYRRPAVTAYISKPGQSFASGSKLRNWSGVAG